MGSLSYQVLFFTVVMLMESTVYLQSLPDINDQGFISDSVAVHNEYRSKVEPCASDMKEMSWDNDLAKTASKWAKHCSFSHNPDLKQPGKAHPTFSTVGENIWVGGPPHSFSVARAIKLWYDEVTYYDYTTNACTKICGHYTQVVWAKSYKVGCAVQTCPNGITGFSDTASAIYVCDYGPAGNYKGQQPYTEGSNCFTSSASCNSFCIAVLITRPVSVIVIFAAAYGLQMFYPNMFIYE
ncbi:glioma pathogenesis-related protein 1 [Amia ocellicauda]|uniref:glioma pathogenesis-related protein 1 n=1 Tax=Amia ocellicauda TaxID=2972642 RepID=UPI0034646F7B